MKKRSSVRKRARKTLFIGVGPAVVSGAQSQGARAYRSGQNHKHPKVIEWLGRHQRWTFHFTPTSASWINAVEGFFAILTKRRLKRGIFKGVVDLQAAINRFIADHNQQPKPFVWAADPDKIIAAAARGHQVLDLMRFRVTCIAAA
jgi:transposase